MPGYREGIDETAENVYYMGISMYFRSTEVVTMARKQDTNMVHCSSCGEDYSATYKFCPFCGGRNAPAAPASGAKASSEEYQFDGQDVFDQPDASPAGKGGKRLAGTGAQRPTPPPPINWPRLITFLCSLVIIADALVMVFTVVYPHLRGASNPDAAVSPSLSASQDPNASATVGPDGLKGMTLDTVDLIAQRLDFPALQLLADQYPETDLTQGALLLEMVGMCGGLTPERRMRVAMQLCRVLEELAEEETAGFSG